MKTAPSTPMQVAEKIVKIANILNHDKQYELCKFQTLRSIYKIVGEEEYFPSGYMDWLTNEIVSNNLPNNSSGSTISALLDIDNFLAQLQVSEEVEDQIIEVFRKGVSKTNQA